MRYARHRHWRDLTHRDQWHPGGRVSIQDFGPERRYRKRPVVISAAQWCGPEPLAIVTLEGTMLANPGDYVITGIKGEKYPCKPDIFDATYELAE
jgi:hypothetical protein